MSIEEQLEQYILARMLYWRYELESFSEPVLANIQSVLNTLSESLKETLIADADYLAGVDWKQERLQELDAWLDEVLLPYKEEVLDNISNAGATVGQASVSLYNDALTIGGTARNVRTIGFTPTQLQNWFDDSILGHSTLNGWVDDVFSIGIKDKVIDAIRTSGVTGQSTDKTVRDMLNIAVNDGVDVSRREAEGLARTYMQTANVGAMKDMYRANEDLIKGYVWTSVLDLRVCKRCAVLDGTFYETMEEAPPIPTHVNCRCVLLVTLKTYRDLGIDIDEADEVMRLWNTRTDSMPNSLKDKVNLYGTHQGDFHSWWNGLSNTQKNASVGKVRRQLVDSGQVGWDSLVNKSTGEMYTLKQLGYDLNGKKLK